MKRLLAVVLVTLAAAGCSGSPSPSPSASPATSAAETPAASASADGSPTASASATGASTTPASSCLTGTYRLVRFVGAGANNTYGTGQGGDITVAFTDGEYLMTGAGKEPVTVTLAGQSAPLTVDGTIEGVYSGTGEQVSFTRGRTTGSATITAEGKKRTLTMAQIANVLGLSGDGKLACTQDQLSITLKAVRLELEK